MASSKTPTTPAQWKDCFTQNTNLKKLPSTTSSRSESLTDEYVLRDMYMDFSAQLTSSATIVTVCTDTLAFANNHEVLRIRDGGCVTVYARVLSANGPLNLQLSPDTTDECSVILFATVLDQPITVSGKAGTSEQLQLGTNMANIGVEITLASRQIKRVEYMTRFPPPEICPRELRDHLRSQLRVATIFFWQYPEVAVSMAANIFIAGDKDTTDSEIAGPAAALQQQLVAQKLAGPNSSYAPSLQISIYLENLKQIIQVAKSFQAQFDRFQDREVAQQDMLAIWGQMLDHSKSALEMQTRLKDSAFKRYSEAKNIVFATQKEFNHDQDVLEEAHKKFQEGIDDYKAKKEREAIIGVFTAIIGIAAAIGALFVGDGAALASIPGVVTSGVKALQAVQAIGKTILQVETLKQIAEVAMKAFELFQSVEKAVAALQNSMGDPVNRNANPNNESKDIDADLSSIVSLAYWDKWRLETDEQMVFAIDEGIGGAAEYRLELRKHAINGKLLAEAQAQAVKVGQEYVRATMDLNQGKRDVESLEKLKSEYQHREEQTAEAAAKFFDRILSLRTYILIELRNVAWAYKYSSLQESSLKFDLLKSIPEFESDVFTVQREIEEAESQVASDATPFTARVTTAEVSVPSAKVEMDTALTKVVTSHWQLPSGYGPQVVEALKKAPYRASFTLATDSKLAGPFVDGCQFRVQGLNAVLKGAVPKPEALARHGRNTLDVTIGISTSGVYSNITQDGTVLQFTSIGLERHFGYEMGSDGSQGRVITRSTFPGLTHTDPTPFTQWTIELENGDELDLSNFSGVELEWEASKYYAHHHD